MFAAPHRPVRDIQAAPYATASTTQVGPWPLKAAISVLSVATLAVSGVGYFTIGRLGDELSSASNLQLGDGGDGFKETLDGAVDIVLVGSDSRTDAQGNVLSQEELDQLHAGESDGEENTDTIMIIRVPNDGSRASAISIPRDTYIHDPELGNMKINGVYSAHKTQVVEELTAENEQKRAEGASDDELMTQQEIEMRGIEAGRAALLEQMRALTGVEIDHYAEVGLLGFVLLTEAVDGVEVCLNNPVDDEMSGAKFDAGEQTLRGAQALAFVRQRYGLPRGDLDRIVRQQAFMASLVNEILDTGTLTSPSKLAQISQAVERSVVIDEGWDVMSFATQLSNLAAGNVTFNTIPVTSVDGTGDYGESIVTVDVAEVHRFMDDLAESKEEAAAREASSSNAPTTTSSKENAATAAGVAVHVLNAGSIAGLASGVGAWLENEGYTVERTANAQPGIYSESQVVAADANDPNAQELAQALGGLPVTSNPSLDGQTLIVVTADSYTGPTAEGSEPSEEMPTITEEPVGTPGADFGTPEVAPEISAGGSGVRCVN